MTHKTKTLPVATGGIVPRIAIQKQCYAMAMMKNDEAEITMYGEIVESRPIDWWTGEEIPGDFIIQNEFLDDLKQVTGAKKLTIRMNSIGGHAGVAILIHNRLREMARNGTELVCVVDGVAMSGGALIVCACDTVTVNPLSLIMIHKCLTSLWGAYNADELREQATQNDAWDKAQVAIIKRKCGLSDTVILHMMAETTTLTGKEAIDKGLADNLLDDAEPLDIAASADGSSLYVRGRKVPFMSGIAIPGGIPVMKEAPAELETKAQSEATPAPVDANKAPETTGEGGKPMATNIEELRKESPDLVKQVEASASAGAIAEERKRLQEIDSISCLYDDALVTEAKYGEHACSAQELAYRAAQQQAKQGRTFVIGMEKDAKASGAADVGAAAIPAKEGAAETPESIMAQAKADAEAYNKSKEVR
jgi:ATP-dependent protease ClpP protease subunit